MMPSKIILNLLLEQAVVLLILLLHLEGFMNVSNVSENSDFTKTSVEDSLEKSPQYRPNKPFSNKTVLLIIDALRADHLVTEGSSYMPYSKDLIETRKGIGYLVKTASPTVTLPRLKSIITGSIPNFMDVIFNFASDELLDHNIIHSSVARGLKINFYGDETWLKLFPKSFHHSDGVTSFFVTDYTEVDDNITRHIPNLFAKNKDWDVLILHYLGLDHIGHLDGSKSPLIATKLTEMDNIIKDIHHHLKEEGDPYFLLVCGDHGMADVGGHGGDSHAEIYTSALMVSHLTDSQETPSYTSPIERMRNQVDLASTLALQLGVEIPLNNVGVPLAESLEKLPFNHQLNAHYRLAKQLMKYATKTQEKPSLDTLCAIYEMAVEYHLAVWQREKVEGRPHLNDTQALKLYREFEHLVSDMLTENVASYDLPLLLSTSVILIMISLPTIIWTLFLDTSTNSASIYEWKLISLIVIGGLALFVCNGVLRLPTPALSTYCVVVLFCHGVRNVFSFAKCFTDKFEFRLSVTSLLELVVLVGVFLQPLSLLATSLVEEEHYGLYFSVSVFYFVLLGSLMRRNSRNSYCQNYNEEETAINLIADSENGPTTSFHHPIIAYPVLYNFDSRLLQVVDKRVTSSKECVLHVSPPAVVLQRLYSSQFLLLSLCFTLFRFLREFNATGDKWKHLAHFNDFLRQKGNEDGLLSTVIIGLTIAFLLFYTYTPVLVAFITVTVFGRFYPILEKGVRSGTLEAQFAYLLLFSFFLYAIVRIGWYKHFKIDTQNNPLNQKGNTLYFMQIFEAFFAFLFLLLQRPENVLVSALSLLHSHLIIPILVKNHTFFGLPRMYAYVIAYWIAQAHFFIQGNSNSLRTVQISAGFVGVTSYLPVLHGTLIAIHTFGAKFLVLLHTLIVILCKDFDLKRVGECLRCWWMLQLLALTVYVINVTLQRHHLFIWSVFGPKLLYEESHFLTLTILTIVVFVCFRAGRAVAL